MEHISTTWALTDDGGTLLTVANLNGDVIKLHWPAEDALANLVAFAKVYGLVVSQPLS